ncbi:MAG: SUMF1/EgtB/PvdO family nonheme iron enzyme [Gallionella sp.]
MKTKIYLLLTLCLFTFPVMAEEGPADARRHMIRGVAAIEMAKSNAELTLAADEFRRATELDPSLFAAWFNLGSVQAKLGQFNEAIESYKRYLTLVPKAEDAQKVQDEMIKLEFRQEQVTKMSPVMVHIPGKNYELGKYEVTQYQWRAVMGNDPSKFTNCGDTCPVEQVSWNDIQEYLQKLNAKTGRQYRLPSKAEWEYACYGSSQTEYCGGNDINAVAWYEENSNSATHPVGQKQANGYGLYDMSGNVAEWIEDKASNEHDLRYLLGSDWYTSQRSARAVNNLGFEPTLRRSDIGFRLARTFP